jgi:hypothetical protein
MSLVSLKTNLKSLRYGQDRVGGGSSNQPYIKSKIPDNSSSLDRSGGVDFLLRGGTLTPSRAAKDVSRLTQMFFDFKSPNGVLFTAKQNLLSRTGVKTQASGILNEGAYLPTSTILQAGGNAFGIHLNKQGLDPTKGTGPNAGGNSLFNLLGLRDPLGLPVYTENLGRIQSERTNRLVQLKYKKIGPDKINPTSANATTAGLIGNLVRSGIFSTLLSSFNQISSNPGEILKYGGGPGSALGIGKTILKRYSDTNEGETKAKTAQPEKKSLYGKTPFKNITPTQTSKDGVFTLRNSYLYTNTNDGLNFDKVGNSIFKGRYYVLDAKTIFNKTTSKTNTEIQDFRTSLLKEQATGLKKNILSASPDYTTKNIEQRVNLGDPGKRDKNVSSYSKGTGDILTRDLITAMPLYKSSIANHGGDRNDLVKFSIGIIDNDDPKLRTYIHFRAFLDSMDDNYAAEWNDFKYMGRGEKFYRYNGFTRTINLGWTVAAQSKEELIPMYQKLNFLASSLAPDYSANGYMRGNLAVITVGGYLFDQPGIINSINYSVPTESPWEIGINDSVTNYGYDTSVKELPHIIKVTGFSFTPIHKFVPKLQKNTYEGTYANKGGTLLTDPNSGESKVVISKWDQEGGRYIALATGVKVGAEADINNYDSPGENYTWGPIAQARRKIAQENLALENSLSRARANRESSLTAINTAPNTQGIITSR